MSSHSPLYLPEVASLQSFKLTSSRIVRSVILRNGATQKSSENVRSPLRGCGQPGKIFQDSWLRRSVRLEEENESVTIADLFSGCGGLSVGAHEAARAVGCSTNHVFAVDNNEEALSVYGDNFPEAELKPEAIETLVDGNIGDRLSRRERRLRSQLAGLDLLLGGPPCQGHSDLNNYTRRDDPRNMLYLKVVRFAEVVRPRCVLIENVPGVAHDKNGVVNIAQTTLKNLGYFVSSGLLRATDFGAAQNRRRHVLVASLDPSFDVDVNNLSTLFGVSSSTVWDTISDIGVNESGGTFETPARHSLINESRINFLFENDLYDLPNSERPDCHRLKPHSYISVYGRMHPDLPAPTITSGFGSTGQGRFVHPFERRTLTPHEAARLQGFPDWFHFDSVKGRRALQIMIGNAVPSQLAYAAIVGLLR